MLKPDYQPDSYSLRYFMNTTASPGVIVSIAGAGSGVAMDATLNVVEVAGASSGARPLGLLLDEVVSIDLTRTPINWHKRQAVVGDKVSIMTKGWAVTDQTVSATAGAVAVLASSGSVMNQPAGAVNPAANPVVGHFRTNRDEAGFAAVYIDL